MRKRLIALCLVAILSFVAGLVSLSGSVSAYFVDNPNKQENGETVHKQCFTMQWLSEVKRGDTSKLDESKGQNFNIYYDAYSTKWFCTYPDGDGKSSKIIEGSGAAIKGSTLVGDKLGGSDGFRIWVTTDGKGIAAEKYVSGKTTASDSKTFKLSDYDGDFKKLTQDLSNWLPDELPVGGLFSNEKAKKYTENKALTTEEINEMEKGAEEDTFGTTNNKDSEDLACYENSGALGWILCPLISKVTDALGTVYDSMVEPFLVIEPELLQGDGTYTAWDIFRNFANIAFVILFLAVIFSQLTGVGIDNYGIKRMLPKLIVAAVLINLSYLICQLAVDVSNILGNSLNSLFINIAGQVDAAAASPTEFFSRTVSTVGSVLGIGTMGALAFVMFTTTIASGFALIIPIFAAVISAIIAVLFMFVILFVRKAIAILLVAVAPVAFVAYIMPNTKRVVFDKWLNVFKGILLLYPLAGALIGGGLLASSIIVSALGTSAESGNAGLQEFFMYIGALLIQVVPFFFLPTLFRRSLAALGNVGERLGRAGAQFGAGASRRFRENEGVRAMQTTLAAGREGGLRQRIASHRGMRYLGGNGMARNRMRYQKLRSDEGSLGAMFGEDYMLATETANVMKELEASGDINNSGLLEQRLQAALVANDSHTTEGRARIRAYTDALSAKGDSGRDAVKRAYNSAAPNMSQTAAETFSANIMANHAADYKNNSRSMFDIANGINNGSVTRGANGYQTTGQYVGANKNRLQTSAKAETMAAMDDSAFAEAFMNGSYENGTVNNLNGLNTEERLAVGENAYHALQNTTNMKADRVALLKQVLKQSGYRPPVQEVHNNP